MEKTSLTQEFATRLREAMIAAGFNSSRSSSGVSVDKLAKMTHYSVQICRKYLRGEAIPDPIKLLDIAAQLNVSAGWLLFGENDIPKRSCEEQVTINRNVLHYMFSKATNLYQSSFIENEIPNFLIDLITDVSLINANEEQSKKIIDLALSSVKHFRQSPTGSFHDSIN